MITRVIISLCTEKCTLELFLDPLKSETLKLRTCVGQDWVISLQGLVKESYKRWAVNSTENSNDEGVKEGI